MENRKERMRERAREYLDSHGLLTETAVINTTNVDTDPMDRISQLPDHVLVHIATFLPSTRDLVYLSAVSKTWHRVWTLSSIRDFSEKSFISQCFHKPEDDARQKFMTFVQNTLFKQCHQNKRLHRFRLQFFDVVYPISVVDDWIELALHFFCFKNLHLCLTYAQFYPLTQTIFSAKELNVLRLEGGRMNVPQENNSIINWPSLRKLHLSDAQIDEEIVDSLIFSCPLIEKFTVSSCSSLKRIQLSGFTKLMEVKVDDPFGDIQKIMIDALSLNFFQYTSNTTCSHQKLDLKACKNLEELKLKPFGCRYSTPEEIETFPTFFVGVIMEPPKWIDWPSLRELHLSVVEIDEGIVDSLIFSCPLIEKFVVSFRSGLKRFNFRGFTKLREVGVDDENIERIMMDALSLKLFLYKCSSRYRLKTLDLKACKDLEKLKLVLYCMPEATSFVLPQNSTILRNVSLSISRNLCKRDLVKLGKFLGDLGQIQLLTLRMYIDMVAFNRKSLRHDCIPQLPKVKQLKLNVIPPPCIKNELNIIKVYQHILHGVLWICHPDLCYFNQDGNMIPTMRSSSFYARHSCNYHEQIAAANLPVPVAGCMTCKV